MQRRALVLGGIPDVLEPAGRLGIETIFFQREEGAGPASHYPADEYHAMSFDDHEAMVARAQEIHRQKPLDCVISFSELGMIPAAMIAERLGLPGASRVATARLLRDKLDMRSRLNSAGLSPVGSWLVRSPDEARKFAASTGYPVILKPRDGTGSMGVRRVNSEAELSDAVASAFSDDGCDYLLEEFMAGPEFSVEAFSFDGTHRVIAITEKQVTTNFVESGHIVPARVADGDQAAIFELVRSFLDLAEVTDGPSHTEVILSNGKPRIVESHDRLGGDKIFRLVELVYGVNLISWCYEWPLGMMGTPPQPAATGGASIQFLLPAPGQVESISIPGSVRSDQGLDQLEVEVSVGDQVRPLAGSPDRAGFVIASAPDPQAAVEAAERLADRIQIKTVPVPA
jgi:biotin carboxylase